MKWHDLKLQLPLTMTVLLIGEFGEELWRTEGHYHARRFSYLLIFLLLFAVVNLKKKYLNSENIFKLNFLKQIIFLVLVYWNYKIFRDPKVIYLEISWINYVFKYSSLLFCLIFSYFTMRPEKFLAKMGIPLFIIIFIFRILTIYGSPNPLIDVFTSNTAAVKSLLNFVNPYTIHYVDIYKGGYDYQPGLAYWPGIFLWQAPSFILFKDIRVFFILSEILILFGFLKLMKNLSIEKSLPILICLLWSFFPVQNFVLEQSWIDPGLMALTIWFCILLQEKKIYKSAIILGIIVATKQYAVVTAIIFIPYLIRALKIKRFISYVSLSLISFSIIILPFYLTANKQFIQMTITGPSLQAFRVDSFNLLAIAWNNYQDINFLPLTWIMPLFFLIISFIFVIYKKDFKDTVLGLFICYLGIFLFGKQAFCNYYFFLMIFLFIFFIFQLSRRDSQTLFEQ